MENIRIFSKKSIDKLLTEIKYLNTHDTLYEEFMNTYKNSYKFLKNNYRNEYYFKNLIFNKMVLGRRSLNTTSCLNEVNINNSKADIVMINKGNPVVFEIKTELDNFEKLEHQIEDYFKVSPLVYVVTSESMYYPLYRILKNTNVGIYILTSKDTFSMKKKALEDYSKIEHKALFKLLRKPEYEKIILDNFGIKPSVKDYEYFTACFNMFSKLKVEDAIKIVFKQLQKRDVINFHDTIISFPSGFRWLIYSSNLKEDDYNRLLKFFNNSMR